MSTPSDAIEDEHLHAEQQTTTRYSLTVDSSSVLDDDELTNTHKDAPPLTRPIKINVLDPTYCYNPYLGYDKDNEAHYRYEQSPALRTFFELPELQQAGRSELLAACATVYCVGLPCPEAEPLQGYDFM